MRYFQSTIIIYIGLDPHLKSSSRRLDAIKIKNPHSKNEWINLIETNSFFNNSVSANQAIYLQVSGVVMRIENILMETLNQLFIFKQVQCHFESKKILLKGKSAISRDDIRWSQCNTKGNFSLLANTQCMRKRQRLKMQKRQFFVKMVLLLKDLVQMFLSLKNNLYILIQRVHLFYLASLEMQLYHCAEKRH